MKRRLFIGFFVLVGMLCGCGQKTHESSGWIPDNSVVDLDTVTASYDISIQKDEKDDIESNDIELFLPTPNKVLVIGNSITLGFGTHGMASSSIESDYYHILNSFLSEKNINLEMSWIDGRPWENSVNSFDRAAFIDEKIKPIIDSEMDLVIIQLGDNLNTSEKRLTYQEDAIVLVREIQNFCPNARILWVFGWYGVNLAPSFLSICEKTDIDYVDITNIASDPNNKSYVGAEYIDSNGEKVKIEETGVASHPGDEGMKLIAETIINALNLQ